MPDDRESISLTHPVFIPNLFYPLSDAPEVSNLIAVGKRQLDNQRSVVSALLAQGATWVPGKGVFGAAPLFQECAKIIEQDQTDMGAAFDACAKLASRR